jgi:hypothetical protein
MAPTIPSPEIERSPDFVLEGSNGKIPHSQ